MTIDGTQLSLILGIIGGILGIFSIFLGCFSVWLAWKLFLAGNQTQVETLKLLGEIKTSAQKTEFTSVNVNEKIMTALLGQLGSDVSAKLTIAQRITEERTAGILEELAPQLGEDELKKIKARISGEIANRFGAVRYETSKATSVAEGKSQSPVQHPPVVPPPVVPPGLSHLILWLDSNKHRFKFFGVRYLHQTIFRGDSAIAEAIDFGIHQKVFIVKKEPNPNDAKQPTTAIVLKYDHPIVIEILGKKAG